MGTEFTVATSHGPRNRPEDAANAGEWGVYDPARWVAQLDATQRQAYAAHLQDRLRVLDRVLRLVVKAKRQGKLPIGY